MTRDKRLQDRLTWQPGDVTLEPPEPVVDYEVKNDAGEVVEVSYHYPGEEPGTHRVYFGPTEGGTAK